MQLPESQQLTNIIGFFTALGLLGLGLFQAVKFFIPKKEVVATAIQIQDAVWRSEVQQLLKSLATLAEKQAGELSSIRETIQLLTLRVDQLTSKGV